MIWEGSENDLKKLVTSDLLESLSPIRVNERFVHLIEFGQIY